MGTDRYIKYGPVYMLCIILTCIACYFDRDTGQYIPGLMLVLGIKSASGLLALIISEKYLRLYNISYLTGIFFIVQIVFSFFIFWATYTGKNIRWECVHGS